MALETETDVEEIRSVQDENGEPQKPANEQQQQQLRKAIGNFAAGVDGSETDDGTGSTLPAQAIPDGVTVLVQAQYSNSGRIAVGLTDSPTIELQGGQSIEYRVANLSQIHVEAATGGDGVAFSAEVTA